MKKLLITGNRGYLGSFVSFNLFQLGTEYKIYGCDYKDGQDFFTYDFREAKNIDFVIHLAAEANARFPFKDYLIFNNAVKTIDFIKRYFSTYPHGFFIFASSSTVHIRDYNPYGFSKALVEDFLLDSNYENWVIIRFYNIVGPSHAPMPEFRLFSRAKSGKLKTLYVNVLRNYVSIIDCYWLIRDILSKPNTYKKKIIDFHSPNNIMSNLDFIKTFFPKYDLSNVELIELPENHWENKVPVLIKNNSFIESYSYDFRSIEDIKKEYEKRGDIL